MATALIGATAEHRRNYGDGGPYLKPQLTSPFAPLAAYSSLRSKYPPKHSSKNILSLQRNEPQIILRPKHSNSFRMRPIKLSGEGPLRQIHNKPSVSSGFRSDRPQITNSINHKPINKNKPIYSMTRSNGVQENVETKPVFEEGMVPKKPVFVNTLSESNRFKSQNSEIKYIEYEPLGNYAKFEIK